MSFSAVDVITTKREGGEISDAAISWILDAYQRGDVAEEQMSALLMAIFFRGMDQRELRTWTDRMIASGETLDLRGLSRPSVDKHSTGGVGDKISLILAPLVGACGAAVPQLSGQGSDTPAAHSTSSSRYRVGALHFPTRRFASNSNPWVR